MKRKQKSKQHKAIIKGELLKTNWTHP